MYSSDNPDTSQPCYPCSCPDCPGFHECDFYFTPKKWGDVLHCDVCGTTVRYEQLTTEDITTFNPNLTEERKEQLRLNGGKFVKIND